MPSEPLDLKPIHLPDPVSWWPLAAGWWWLLAGFSLLVMALYILWKMWQKKITSVKTLSLKEFARVEQNYQQSDQEFVDQKILVEELSALLRRSAISQFGRTSCAGLTGESWLRFLDDVMSADQFCQGAGRSLISAPYQAENSIDTDALINLCKQWIEALP